MNINGEKTKILIAGEQEGIPSAIMLQNHALQEAECFCIYRKSDGSNWKGGEGSDIKNREGWDSVPDLEEKSLLKPQPE